MHRRVAVLLMGALAVSAALFLAGAGRGGPLPLCNYGQITKLADPSLSAPSPTYPGNTITSSGGSWSSCAEPFTGFYQEWLRDGVVFNGPTWVGSSPGSFTYVAQDADVGHSIRSAVLPCNADGCYISYAQSTNAVVPSATPPPPPPPPPPPGDAPVVATGYVRDLNGLAVGGATVELYLDVATDSSVNQSAPIATTTSDKFGYFVLGAPYSGSVAAEALANDGWVNFAIEATAGDMPYDQVAARKWDPASNSWLTPQQVDGGSSTTTMPAYDDTIDLTAQPGASVKAGDWPNLSGPCRYASYETTTLLAAEVQPTVIGELHVARDATGTFTYGKGSRADSYISIGLSSGGWHLGGYRHIATTSSGAVSITNTTEDWAHKIISRFTYGLFKHERSTVDPVTGTIVSCGSSLTKNAMRWLGNIELGDDLSQYLHRCLTTYLGNELPYGPNATFDRSSRRLNTWDAAATVNLGTGNLALRAWSGASRWVTYHYAFGTRFDKHWLCGNDNYPLYATRIFAGG